MEEKKLQKKGQLIDRLAFIIAGMLIMFLVAFFWQSKRQSDFDTVVESKYSSKANAKVDTLQVGNYTLHIKERNEIEIKEQSQLIDEKLKSLHDRISDLYYSLAIIVTLLVFGLLSVYFRTESEVARHMDENYKKYKLEIEGINAEAQEILTDLKTKSILAEQISPKQNPQQAPPQQAPIQPMASPGEEPPSPPIIE